MADKMIADSGVLNGAHLASVLRKGKGLLIRESNGETHDMAFPDEETCQKVLKELHWCMDTGRTWSFQKATEPIPMSPSTPI